MRRPPPCNRPPVAIRSARLGGDFRRSLCRGIVRLELGEAQFGASGIYILAAIVGVTDIDPFVLNLAQGGTSGMSNNALAAAILIAASSNNVLKAIYAAVFGGGRATAASAVVLMALAAAGIAIAAVMGGLLG